jgi:hypothetical protein
MDERILNRFSLDDPDWDLLLCELLEDEPEDDRSERWPEVAPAATTLR